MYKGVEQLGVDRIHPQADGSGAMRNLPPLTTRIFIFLQHKESR